MQLNYLNIKVRFNSRDEPKKAYYRNENYIRGNKLFPFRPSLFCPENSISGITKSRTDVSIFI